MQRMFSEMTFQIIFHTSISYWRLVFLPFLFIKHKHLCQTVKYEIEYLKITQALMTHCTFLPVLKYISIEVKQICCLIMTIAETRYFDDD